LTEWRDLIGGEDEGSEQVISWGSELFMQSEIKRKNREVERYVIMFLSSPHLLARHNFDHYLGKV